MSQNCDSAPTNPDERILRDAGRWAPERDAIKATCRNEYDQHDDELDPMSAMDIDKLVDEVLEQQPEPPPTPPPWPNPEELEPDQLDTEPGHRRCATPKPQAPRPRIWRNLVSHGLVALAAAAVTLSFRPRRNSDPTSANTERYRMTPLQRTHASANDQEAGYCLSESVWFRIDGDRTMPATEELEVVLGATPESGLAQWYLHRPVARGWRLVSDGTALSFQGPLGDLARLDPGVWTLTIQVGPRGRCGPNAEPGCTVLDTVPIRIAPPSRC
ncbi:MAG: hypothetical protein AAGF11_04595 [Myxococcota bacterium]